MKSEASTLKTPMAMSWWLALVLPWPQKLKDTFFQQMQPYPTPWSRTAHGGIKK